METFSNTPASIANAVRISSEGFMFHVSKYRYIIESHIEVSCFLLELVRPPHVGDLPVVVVSEVVGGACPLIHQIVRPLPSTEVPYNK